MPHQCQFLTLDDAIAWARQHGGWIANCKDGTVLWFSAENWTLTPICHFIGQRHDGGEVGTWPLWDAKHPCHSLLKGAA